MSESARAAGESCAYYLSFPDSPQMNDRDAVSGASRVHRALRPADGRGVLACIDEPLEHQCGVHTGTELSKELAGRDSMQCLRAASSSSIRFIAASNASAGMASGFGRVIM